MKDEVTELSRIEHPLVTRWHDFVGFAEMASALEAGGLDDHHRPDPAHAGGAGQRDQALQGDRPASRSA